MTKVVFVDLHPSMFDLHGVYSLTAMLKKQGINCEYIHGTNRKKILQKVLALAPDLILYSSFASDVDDYVTFDKMVKGHKKITSVIGGPGPTFTPQSFSESTIDAVCIGEGESALPAFIEGGFSAGRNIVSVEAVNTTPDFFPLVDLDRLPFPDRDIVYREDTFRKNKSVKHFLSGRGCPYDCTYCHNHVFRNLFRNYGTVVRKKSVDYLIEEILIVKKQYGLTSISFSDDTFIIDREWFKEFCNRYPDKVGVPYTCGIRANLVNEDIAAGLRDSGCQAVNWSIETGNEQLRNGLLHRQMSNEQIMRAAFLLSKYKVPFWTANVIGFPGETYEQLKETIEMNISVRPEYALAKIFTPFPGLQLTNYAIEKGYLDPDNKVKKNDFFAVSRLNFSVQEKIRLSKLMSLFPLFIGFPTLYRNPFLRKILYLFPSIILRIVYELYTSYKTMQLYVYKMSIRERWGMMVRYIRSLLV